MTSRMIPPTILINDKPLADYFEEALKSLPQPQKRLQLDHRRIHRPLQRDGQDASRLRHHEPNISAKLVNMIEKGTITGKIAKSVADDMVLHPGKDPETDRQRKSRLTSPSSDTSSIEPLVDQVLAANPQSVADFKAGKGRAFDFLVGQVMKLCKGKASPAIVGELLNKKLQS